jgi:hypothetical protein
LPPLASAASGIIEVKDIENIYKGLSHDIVKLRNAGQAADRNMVGARFLYEMILLKT